MTKTEKARLAKLSSEALIEGFVTEAKLNEPDMPTTAAQMKEHGTRSRAYASESIERGGSQSLFELLDYSDDWIGNCAARALVVLPETKDRALVALDRIAEKRCGSASASADIARNMIRYGNPSGDPVEVEKRLALIRTRES